jgi:hypothetical protein
LIETESREVIRLRMIGPEIKRLYCERCEKVEELLDLNSAADISGAAFRDLLQRIETGELHSPEHAGGHLFICRRSLEQAINRDERLRPSPFKLEANTQEDRLADLAPGFDSSSVSKDLR